jgi:hypothetical protein
MSDIQVPVFGEAETITVNDIQVGDFVVEFPAQHNVRGVRVNSAVRDYTPRYDTWTRNSGYRRPRHHIPSMLITFEDRAWRGAGLDYPLDFTVIVRRPQAVTS